jgi:hypothetical protein
MLSSSEASGRTSNCTGRSLKVRPLKKRCERELGRKPNSQIYSERRRKKRHRRNVCGSQPAFCKNPRVQDFVPAAKRPVEPFGDGRDGCADH